MATSFFKDRKPISWNDRAYKEEVGAIGGAIAIDRDLVACWSHFVGPSPFAKFTETRSLLKGVLYFECWELQKLWY